MLKRLVWLSLLCGLTFFLLGLMVTSAHEGPPLLYTQIQPMPSLPVQSEVRTVLLQNVSLPERAICRAAKAQLAGGRAVVESVLQKPDEAWRFHVFHLCDKAG